MNPGLLAYNLVFCGASPALLPLWLTSKLTGRWGYFFRRAGLYTHLAPAGPGPRVWLQAVSVGEVAVAQTVAEEIWSQRPGLNLTITTSTDKGLARAQKAFGDRAAVTLFPLDLPWAVITACGRIKPDVYASLETEVWPNLLAHLQGLGASLLMLNGRISPRSFPRYQKVPWLTGPALRRFDILSMIGREDARRVIALGAEAGRVRVDGNAKYAGLLDQARPGQTTEPAARLALGQSPLLVAGSVRGGEERPVLGAFRAVLEKHPRTVLAVAPRHVERAPRWMEACAKLGLPAVSWSRLQKTGPRRDNIRVVVVDAMGVLMGLYGLAAGQGGAAFLGASLVPLGGQNPMEPAAWGLPACFGPSMEDFADAAEALDRAGAARRIEDGAGLAECWLEALDDPRRAIKQGREGMLVVARWSEAARAAAGHILTALDKKGAL